MIRRIAGLLILSLFCLLVSACQKKDQPIDPTRPEQPATSAERKIPVGSPDVSTMKISNAPGSGAKPASIPASLFKIPDKKMMAKNYEMLKERMLGDLESELKWQEKMENLETLENPGTAPASGAMKK